MSVLLASVSGVNVTVTPFPASLVLTAYQPTVTIGGDNAYENAVILDGAVFLAPLDEASGDVLDIIGGKVGTATGTATYGVTGPITGKTAIGFGTAGAEYFTFADHADLDLGDGPFTIEFWFRRVTDTGGQVAVLNKGTNAYSNAVLSTDKVSLGKTGVANMVSESGTTAADSVWHHLAVTRSSSGTDNTLWYKDSVEGHTDISAGTVLADTASALELGREGSSGPGGTLAYLAIYKSVLSAGQVAAHYAAATAGPVTVTPGTASLTITTFVPVVTGGAGLTVTPGTASLTLTTFAPQVNLAVIPPTASLVLTTFAPQVNLAVTPATAALTLTTFAPQLRLAVIPATAALTLTTFAPTVTAGAGITVVPGTAALAMTAFAPATVLSDNKLVTPGTASLALSPFAPTVTATSHQTVTPGTAALVLTTFAPVVTGFVPTISGGAPPAAYATSSGIPAGSAEASQPAGAATSPKPDGSATSPRPEH